MEKRAEYQMAVRQNASDVGEFKFKNPGYAEQVLRGLVHSGYEVTIKEVYVDLTPEELREMEINRSRSGSCAPTYQGEEAECCEPRG